MQRIVLLLALVLSLAGAGSANACQLGERPIARRPVLAVASAPVRLVLALRNRECCRHRNVTVRRRGLFGRDVTVERSIVVRRGDR